MKAITTITISENVSDEFIPLAKELEKSPLLMEKAKEIIKQSVIKNIATKGEKVTVTIEYVENN